jgi:hypothetical protein
MGIVLPDEVAWVLDLIGVEWPNVDEDELRSIADDLRGLAEELKGHNGDAKSDIASMLGVNSSESLELFNALWTKIADGHLEQLGEGLSMLGTGLDIAAMVVVGLKLAAIVQLVFLAAELIADQAAAPFTFGASEAAAVVETEATSQIVKQIVKQAVKTVEQQLLQVIEGPIFAALESAGQELAGQLLGNALGTQHGVNLNKVADAGGQGFQQGVQESKDQLAGMADSVVNDPLGAASGAITGQGIPTDSPTATLSSGRSE